MKPNEFRIFLSSTFRDLMPEREQLVKKVFPQIRALCRERDVEFTEIDLRWGITDEEAHSGKTVRICLEEIDRCHPYFLGIIGSRYGWIPETEDFEKDPALFRDFPELAELSRKRKSITEMEFMHGALLRRNKDHVAIYEQLTERDEANAKPIEELRSHIAAAGVPHVTFASPAELGEHVLRDLAKMVERDWPLKKEMTPAERERNPHEAFARNRTHSYIANPEYYERFEKFVNSEASSIVNSQSSIVPGPDERRLTIDDRRPLILWGRSGFGKSALMAHLTSEYKGRHPDAFVVRHFVGASSGASSSDDVIRHIMLEIRERYNLSDDVPNANLQDELPSWLGKIGEGEKMILAIDAVNQLTGIGPEMHWLPEFIPQGVRLIISTTPEMPLEQLRKRGWQEMEILPLTSAQRIRISAEFLERYHKHLPPELLEIIGAEAKLESPLFLRTVLEELRIFGVHEAVDMHLASYLASESEAELFQTVLARMERDHGEETVRNIMKAIWSSRYGLSETELLGITGLSRLALSEFLIALEFHLMKRSGLFTFFHNYLRQAVEFRYLNSEDQIKAAHTLVAEYFSAQEYTQRRRDEEPWQWQQSGHRERFIKCITDIPMLDMLLDEDRRQELIGYWLELQKENDLAETYHTVIEAYKGKCEDESYFADLSGKLGDALVTASSYKEAEYQLRTALELRKKLSGENDLKTAKSMNDLATLYYHTGDFEEAELLLKNVIVIREKLMDKNDPTIGKSLNDLGAIFYSIGKLNEAENTFRDAIERYKEFYQRDHQEIASALNNLGTVFIHGKKYDEASNYILEALAMCERLFGISHITLIQPTRNIAMCYAKTSASTKAEEYYVKALKLAASIYGKNHTEVGSIYANMGVFYSRWGKPDEAIEMHKKGLKIRRELLGEEHIETINSYLNLGITLYRAGRKTEGEKFIKKYLPIQKDLMGEDHPIFKANEASWNELKKA